MPIDDGHGRGPIAFRRAFGGEPEITLSEAASTIQNALNQYVTDFDTKVVTVSDAKTMKIQLKKADDQKIPTFSFEYDTYVDAPSLWANNLPDKTAEFVNTLTASTINILGSTGTIPDCTVTAKQYAAVNLLEKKATAYDPATKQITWELTLNESEVPLTNVNIEDTLPTGLNYVDGSAMLKDGVKPVASQTGNVLKVTIGALTKKKTLTYKTAITPEQVSAFLEQNSVSFRNSAKLNSDEYDQMTPIVADFTLGNTPLAKIASGIQPGRKVTYTVTLNPLGLKLRPDKSDALSLKDTLADGLCPDVDSVKIYKGTPKSTQTGTSWSVALAKGEPVSPQPQVSYNLTENALKIPIPADETPYVITYDAYITRANVMLKNDVSLVGSSIPEQTPLDQAGAQVRFAAGGGATFSLPADVFFSIEVQKADQAGNPLHMEAEFGLYTDPACRNLLMQKKTDSANGVCIFAIPATQAKQYGTLYVKEITPPQGYEASPSVLAVDPKRVNNPYRVTVKNVKAADQSSGSIQLMKKDNTGVAVQGVTFGLFSDPDATQFVGQGTTNGQGKCVFDNLYPGATYYVKELAAPDTHVLSDTVYAFEAGTNQEFSIINAKAEAVIRITKVREDNPNIKLPGAKFKLFADEKGTVQKGDELETDENGVVEFKGLRPNTIYYLRETVVPSGYENQDELLNKLIKIETGGNNANQPVEITVSNKKILVSIKVVKVREGREATKIEGAKFELYESDKQTIAGSEKATDNNGELIFVNLEPQTTYYVKETVTPTGYKTPQNVWTEVKTKDFTDLVPKELKITNEKILVSLHVIKKGDGAAGPRLPGAKLALYEADKTTLVHAAQTTDANGETTFTNLEPETTYYIRETEAPKGYRIKNEWTEVKTGAFDAAKPAATTVVNEKILVGIRVIKVREGDPETKLEGAKFELYSDAEGKSLLRAAQATDANGVTEFLNLQPETVYYLKETEAPSGYRILTDGLIEIKTGEGAEGAQPVERVVENARRRSSSSSRPKPPAEEPETPVVPVGPTDPVNPADPTGPDQPAKPDDPTNPDNPQDAGDPSKPGGSDDPANPDKPGDPSKGDGTVTVPSESTPGGAFGTASSGNRVSSIPETGVRDRIPLWALGLACSLGLAAVLCLSQLIFRPKGKHMKKRG